MSKKDWQTKIQFQFKFSFFVNSIAICPFNEFDMTFTAINELLIIGLFLRFVENVVSWKFKIKQNTIASY